MWNRISEVWCQTMHDRAMWPIHGKYTCPECLREYPVPWEGLPRASEYADPSLRGAGEYHPGRAGASVSMDICA